MFEIDGEMGEGGGQVLRTSLALSVCQGKAFKIANIRAKRKKPGLQPQHLAAVQAATAISRARVVGADIGSRQLIFEPEGIFPGNFNFDIGTAGSTTLVAQTILPALMLASAPSSITLTGGTHNPFAPPFDFFNRAFCALINRMGPRISATLERPGFFPRGGGIMHVGIQPTTRLLPLVLTKRGEIQQQWAEILLAHLPEHIALRERAVITSTLAVADEQVTIREAEASPGPGNVVTLFIQSEQVTEVFTSYGQRGVPAEEVAHNVTGQVREYLQAGVPVGSYLADQLLLPLAIADQGEFLTVKPSSHTRTNMAVINLFTGINFTSKEMNENVWHIGIDA